MVGRPVIRRIRERDGDRLFFETKYFPFAAEDASLGLLAPGDFCVVRDGSAFPLTSKEFGDTDVLEITG